MIDHPSDPVPFPLFERRDLPDLISRYFLLLHFYPFTHPLALRLPLSRPNTPCSPFHKSISMMILEHTSIFSAIIAILWILFTIRRQQRLQCDLLWLHHEEVARLKRAMLMQYGVSPVEWIYYDDDGGGGSGHDNDDSR